MRETGMCSAHLADLLKTRRARLRPAQFDLLAYLGLETHRTIFRNTLTC